MRDDQDKLNQKIHERETDFSWSFGNEGFFEEGMITSLKKMHRICTIYFGEEHAGRAFSTMLAGCITHRTAEDNWEEIIEEDFSSLHAETEIGFLLHDLTAYAEYGIVLSATRDLKQRELLLETQVQRAVELLDLLPINQWNLTGEHLVKLIQKTKARWKIDAGVPADAYDLSILSGLAMQTIKNKLAGNPAEIIGNQNRIEAHEALAWLSAQKGFKSSLWKLQDDSRSIVESDRGMGEIVFLPVAKDGSVFHTGICRNGKYLVDEEGKERVITDFAEALGILQKMHFPQWRRPTPEGKWTRVRAVEWRRYAEDDLEQMFNPPTHIS